MSYLALYRKYRPSSFEDMVGQNEVVNVLKKEILQDKISHAYLFSGPRGTGKTSTAKIIARMVNCENLSDNGVPCGKCNSCLNFNANSDIVEIDAASNNGVDEIRELRDKVNLVPTSSKYKIYIIDEVHMLTNQAFNALLKTLEEPPSHIIFILATTEYYKIPMTVISRCQKFQFSKVSNDEIVSRLKVISKNENINVDDDSLFEIARLSDGGMRDAINMLDQLSSFSDNNIILDDVYKLSGTFSYDDLYGLINSMFSNDYKYIIDFVDSLSKNGKNLNKFIEEFISYLRDVIFFKLSGEFFGRSDDNIKKLSYDFEINVFYRLINLLNELLINLKQSSVPYILLSVSLINISQSIVDNSFESGNLEVNVINNKKIDNNGVNKENLKLNSNNTNGKSNVKEKNILIENVSGAANNIDLSLFDEKFKELRINNTFSSATKDKLNNLKKNWGKIDELLFDTKYGSVVGLLKDVDIIVVGDFNIIFLAKYDSLVQRLYENIKLIEDILFLKFSVDYRVLFLNNDEWNVEKKKYIDNLKNGFKYVYKKENDISYEKVCNDEKKTDDIDKIVDIIGDEMIKYI